MWQQNNPEKVKANYERSQKYIRECQFRREEKNATRRAWCRRNPEKVKFNNDKRRKVI